jgi:hypothetical protein
MPEVSGLPSVPAKPPGPILWVLGGSEILDALEE